MQDTEEGGKQGRERINKPNVRNLNWFILHFFFPSLIIIPLHLIRGLLCLCYPYMFFYEKSTFFISHARSLKHIITENPDNCYHKTFLVLTTHSTIINVLLLQPWAWPLLIDVRSYRPALPPYSGTDIILGVAWPILLPIWLPLPAPWLSGGPGLYAAGACPITHWAAGTALLWWLWLVFCVPR